MQKTQTSDIFHDLHQQLTTGAIPSGHKLKPELLRHTYGCSSNTVREVLLRLSTVGLVVFAEQRGFRAQPADAQRTHDLTVFRIMLEQEGAALSIRNGGIAWEAQLSAAHHKLGHIEDGIANAEDVQPLMPLWSAAEWEFHDTLNSACGSPLLRETFRNIYDQFRQQLITQARHFGNFANNRIEHQKIVEAALARDEPAVRQHIHAHLSRHLLNGAAG